MSPALVSTFLIGALAVAAATVFIAVARLVEAGAMP